MATIITRDTIPYADLLADMRQTQHAISPIPEHLPSLSGIDLYVEVRQLHQFPDENPDAMIKGVGCDLAIIYNFEYHHNLDERIARALAKGRNDQVMELNRNKHRTGIMIADVKGHEPQG
ncbi:MAG: hypothetical protein ABIH41_05050, partial [Nanoarchaeota archaeon]